MCFNSLNIPIKYIATEDITCYKICKKKNNKYYSLYYRKKYIPNKIYRMIKNFYIKKDLYKSMSETNIIYNINKGYHSYMNYITTLSYFELLGGTIVSMCICKFVIPKGSTYYKNEKENIYVSNKIKFIQEIK